MSSISPIAEISGASAVDAAPRPRAALRRFEVAFLTTDGGVGHRSVVAPALAAIEETASAFARGTLLDTTEGPRAIEDLLPGDTLLCGDGGGQQVLWIGSTLYSSGPVPAGSTLDRLLRVPADPALDGLRRTDLLAGPAARMRIRHPRLDRLLDRAAVLAPLTEYVDGERIIAVRPHGAVQLFHLVLRRHALLRAGGLMLESYHPGNMLEALNRAGLLEAFVSLFPGMTVPEDFGPVAFSRTTRSVIDRLIDS